MQEPVPQVHDFSQPNSWGRYVIAMFLIRYKNNAPNEMVAFLLSEIKELSRERTVT